MNNLIGQLNAGFGKVTAKTCEEIIAKVRKIEDEFWTEAYYRTKNYGPGHLKQYSE